MERFFYFRDVPDEASDINDGTSVMVPEKNITGIFDTAASLSAS